ncbi:MULTISPECIES: HNH endonuclease signature motif containing protein [Pseudofrankia]|uniref:HNH endonuclease signature motif containing protein n=1 Tax=Pseudofrankia TaxID=2994363 RepID=UPI001E4DE9D6|nr:MULTISPECIES: HNH endonuclease signature motif containing protein [Pseudofrankia]
MPAGLAGCAEEAAFDLVVELVRLASRLQGLTIRAQVHLARLRPAPSDDGDESGGPYSEFLAAELGQSPRTASGRLARAWDIAHQVPDALDALTSGQLDYPRLLALHDVTQALSDGQRATVEAQMLAGGRLKSPSQWRRKLHRMVARIDPDAAARRRKEAHAQRGVAVQALEDGMGLLSATLAAHDAHAIFERIDRIAKADARADGDRRPIDARRADVLAALLLGNRRELVKVEIQVIAAVGTLAGLDDNPAELVGHGPIPATVGRMLAADANWRRVLTDPDTGTVLDLGHRRIPTPALARLIRHRDTRCVFPGCGMPATCCDIDHTVAHATGGRTALDNLGLLCRHHHSAKQGRGCHFSRSCRRGSQVVSAVAADWRDSRAVTACDQSRSASRLSKPSRQIRPGAGGRRRNRSRDTPDGRRRGRISRSMGPAQLRGKDRRPTGRETGGPPCGHGFRDTVRAG